MSVSPAVNGSSAGGGVGPGEGVREAVTLRTLGRMAREGRAFACLACYDATTARWLERAGVHLLLMGDSAAEVVLGFDRTIRMPLEVSIALTAAVKRGAPRTVVMADMVFGSYQCGDDAAVSNAMRYMVEGLADIVKVEADESFGPLVERMTRAGVPVCGHVGSRPQTAALTSGYASAGRTALEAEAIVRDAAALEAAGAAMLLVEAVPDEVGDEVVRRAGVPVIGIGAGRSAHGQILVVNDLLGLTDHAPRFAAPAASLGPAIESAGREWVRRVGERLVGGESYTMRAGEAERWRAASAGKPVER